MEGTSGAAYRAFLRGRAREAALQGERRASGARQGELVRSMVSVTTLGRTGNPRRWGHLLTTRGVRAKWVGVALSPRAIVEAAAEDSSSAPVPWNLGWLHPLERSSGNEATRRIEQALQGEGS